VQISLELRYKKIMGYINKTIPVHNGNLISWRGNYGVVESSTLGLFRVTGKVWSNTNEQGFYVVSPKTGTRKLFVEKGERMVGDDVVAWIFKSQDGITVEVLNA
jgi:hypothetical protein